MKGPDLTVVVGEALRKKGKGRRHDEDEDMFGGEDPLEDDEDLTEEEDCGQQLLDALESGDPLAVFDAVKVIAGY